MDEELDQGTGGRTIGYYQNDPVRVRRPIVVAETETILKYI